jgi:thymidylate synthase (FAD)
MSSNHSSMPASSLPAPAKELPRTAVEMLAPQSHSASNAPVHCYSHETPMVDLMSGHSRREIKCLDHGFVALMDVMPRMVPQGQTADQAIVQSARVSYGQGTKKLNEDRGLIRYLLRHRHTTPFEMVEFKFHVAMPIFIARQWIRHRTANVNEYSGRYSVMPDQFYRPTVEQVRKQSASNRQGGAERLAEAGKIETAEAFVKYLEDAESLYKRYSDLAEAGVSRELARIGLPVSQYTQWYWKIDLHNLLHFLSLRMDSHAQEEIQVYARAMHDLILPMIPVTMEAWKDYVTGSVRLSRLEVEALRTEIAAIKRGQAGTAELSTDNTREKAEWTAKRTTFGL